MFELSATWKRWTTKIVEEPVTILEFKVQPPYGINEPQTYAIVMTAEGELHTARLDALTVHGIVGREHADV